jgi:metallo-beta-lactamase family protein
MKITFCGAAQTVTGSQHLIEVNGRRILLDCGLYQGRRDDARKRNSHIHYDPKQLDCVILSHAHMDHAGNLPTLVRAGFRGPIYCTAATADITAVMLMDSAKIQHEDAEFLNKHKRRRGEPLIEPLYDLEDADRSAKLVTAKKYFEPFEPVRDVHVTFWDAGHLLGSAIVQLDVQADRLADGASGPRRLVFTGDLGRKNLPILRDPMTVRDVNVLISESTYGDRVHEEPAQTRDDLTTIISKIIQRHGKVIVPAFALGRTQNIVYYLNKLFQDGKLPRVPIYVDSPLSVKVTEVFRNHPECYDADTWRIMRDDPDVFGFFGLTYISSPQDSKRLNHLDGPFVVIASSGMCEAGRVLHHLRYSVADPRNAIVIVGYQAGETLGRRIAERQPRLRIMDDWFDLKADVYVLDGLSSHADRNDFQWWFEATGGAIDHAFLVHGELPAMTALSPLLQPFVKNPVRAPAMYETVEV